MLSNSCSFQCNQICSILFSTQISLFFKNSISSQILFCKISFQLTRCRCSSQSQRSQFFVSSSACFWLKSQQLLLICLFFQCFVYKLEDYPNYQNSLLFTLSVIACWVACLFCFRPNYSKFQPYSSYLELFSFFSIFCNKLLYDFSRFCLKVLYFCSSQYKLECSCSCRFKVDFSVLASGVYSRVQALDAFGTTVNFQQFWYTVKLFSGFLNYEPKSSVLMEFVSSSLFCFAALNVTNLTFLYYYQLCEWSFIELTPSSSNFSSTLFLSRVYYLVGRSINSLTVLQTGSCLVMSTPLGGCLSVRLQPEEVIWQQMEFINFY